MSDGTIIRCHVACLRKFMTKSYMCVSNQSWLKKYAIDIRRNNDHKLSCYVLFVDLLR